MHPPPLVSAAELAQRLADPGRKTLVADCCFDLADPGAGRRAYDAGHIPGAIYLHLDDDLCGTKTGRNGRHPLPPREEFAERMAARGVDADTLVVAVDDAGGVYASRLWWMLRWIGHAATAVLDGGMAAWRAEGLPVTREPAPPPARRGTLRQQAALATGVEFDAVRANLDTGTRLVVDARSPARFRGENETIDPVAGRIPGARNRFFRDNLGADGRFKPAAALRAEWDAVLAGTAPAAAVHLCGSGVTACHNLLALELAGLGGGALYAGSWSEWCAQPGAPVATGPA